MCKRFILIGLDDNQEQHFAPEVLRRIQAGTVFSGGLRHHQLIGHLLPPETEWIDITVPLSEVFERYQAYPEIVVFASGDPLFFGFAHTIQKWLPDAEIELYPTFNSLQTLAHRLVMRYDDMRTVSLTGRPWHELDRALIERTPKIGILTDREHTPATIAQRMRMYGYTHYTLYIGEHLGNQEKERIRRLSIEEAAESTFEHPNNLIAVQEPSTQRTALTGIPRPLFGIPDEQFAHLDGRSRMITKAPIRLLTLSALRLGECTSFWDVGFCTGSVSIEAQTQFPHLQVTAFEIRPEGRELMETNARRFGTPGITVVIGDFLTADLTGHPRPQAIFIGGHGGRLKAILQRIREVLVPGGRVVFNSVTDESRTLFIEGAQDAGLTVCPGTRIALNDYNPIEILTATL